MSTPGAISRVGIALLGPWAMARAGGITAIPFDPVMKLKMKLIIPAAGTMIGTGNYSFSRVKNK
jgi:hypothetical protein